MQERLVEADAAVVRLPVGYQLAAARELPHKPALGASCAPGGGDGNSPSAAAYRATAATLES